MGRDQLEGPAIDGKVVIRMNLKGNLVGSCRLDTSGSGQGLVAGCCEYLNAPSDSIKGG